MMGNELGVRFAAAAAAAAAAEEPGPTSCHLLKCGEETGSWQQQFAGNSFGEPSAASWWVEGVPCLVSQFRNQMNRNV